VPLYAHQLGMSAWASAPWSAAVVVQISFQPDRRAYTDRAGGRSLIACVLRLTAGAGSVFFFAGGFWPAALRATPHGDVARDVLACLLTLGSEMPGGRSLQMGRLNAITNAGQIAGMAGAAFSCCGSASAVVLVLAAMGALAFALGFRVPKSAGTRDASRGDCSPVTPNSSACACFPFAIMCAYISALPFSLSFSFYPILFRRIRLRRGRDPAPCSRCAASVPPWRVWSSRAISITRRNFAVPLACALATALSVGLTAGARRGLVIGLLMVAVGLASGIMTLFFQMLISEISTVDNRGSALALGGWAGDVAFFHALAMGYLTTTWASGPPSTFSAASPRVGPPLIPMHRWAFAKPT